MTRHDQPFEVSIPRGITIASLLGQLLRDITDWEIPRIRLLVRQSTPQVDVRSTGPQSDRISALPAFCLESIATLQTCARTACQSAEPLQLGCPERDVRTAS